MNLTCRQLASSLSDGLFNDYPTSFALPYFPSHPISERDGPRNALLNVYESHPSNDGREALLTRTLVCQVPLSCIEPAWYPVYLSHKTAACREVHPAGRASLGSPGDMAMAFCDTYILLPLAEADILTSKTLLSWCRDERGTNTLVPNKVF